jgi:hypothetical protein
MQNYQPLPPALRDQPDTESSLRTPIARQTPDSSVLSKSMSTTTDGGHSADMDTKVLAKTFEMDQRLTKSSEALGMSFF